MEWDRFQLKWSYNDNLVRLPDYYRADQKFNHGIKGTVQVPLKTLAGIQHPPPFQEACSRAWPPSQWRNVSSWQGWISPHARSFEPLPHVVALGTWEKSSAPPPPLPLRRKLESSEAAPQPPFQTRQTPSPQPLLIECVFQPFYQFCCPPLICEVPSHQSRTAHSTQGEAAPMLNAVE